MNFEKPTLPNPNAVKLLRERFYRIKEDRKNKSNPLIDLFRKKDKNPKSAKNAHLDV